MEYTITVPGFLQGESVIGTDTPKISGYILVISNQGC